MEILKNQKTSWEYLETLRKTEISPNFWCSEEYLKLAGAKIYYNEERNAIWPELDEFCLLPPLTTIPVPAASFEFYPLPIWSDFNQFKSFGSCEFLDWEYIYDPTNFVAMEGKNFSSFRKNVRKLPSRTQLQLEYKWITGVPEDSVWTMFFSWVKNHGVENLQDSDLIEKYLVCGQDRKGLWMGDKLVGINIWDDNWKYVNFRYHFYDPNEPFLSEYLKRLFYIDMLSLNKGKLVNDGGTLGNPNLEFFKDRLNPIIKRKVFTWRKP